MGDGASHHSGWIFADLSDARLFRALANRDNLRGLPPHPDQGPGLRGF